MSLFKSALSPPPPDTFNHVGINWSNFDEIDKRTSRSTSIARDEHQSTETLSFRCWCERCCLSRGEDRITKCHYEEFNGLNDEVIQPMDCRGAKAPRNDKTRHAGLEPASHSSYENAIADRASLVRNDEASHPTPSRHPVLDTGSINANKTALTPTLSHGRGEIISKNYEVYKINKIGYNSDIKHHYYFWKNFTDSSHFTSHFSHKCAAFTLAEVLITLGIIGIVAALTMPTLIQNYRKTLWVNQLKKSMSTIEQGLQKMMADDGVTSLSQLSKPVFGSHNCGTVYEKNVMSVFKLADAPESDYGSKYCIEHDDVPYKTTMVIEPWSDFLGDGYYLQDGTLFGIVPYPDDYVIYVHGTSKSAWASLWLDINGEKKGPNQRGRDIFFYYVLDTGNLLPLHAKSLACSAMYYGEAVTFSDKNWKEWGNSGCTGNDKKTNAGCAARIVEEGWQMNY